MSGESSKISDPTWTYDVFLNFRGEDTRSSFISVLYRSFTDAGIRVYGDDAGLRNGDEVSGSTRQAIEAAKISLVVFSRNYASSRWCLEELVHIMECRRKGLLVVPVFYDVDPSIVYAQRGPFEEAFRRHMETSSEDKVNVWRKALKDAATIDGFIPSISRSQSEAIESILHCVSGLLDKARFFPEDQPETYDVYLSFRGLDTRRTFISHLYKQLTNAGVHVYLDEVELQKGDDTQASIYHAIQASRIAVIVFSENYAQSTWCLRDVEKIMECFRTKGQVVVPVFYCIEPSEVRYQTGRFGEAFRHQMERYSEDELNVWREALTDAANLSGIHLSNSRNESEAIDDIVERITSLLRSKDSIDPEYPIFPKIIVPEHLVGVQSHVQVLAQLLKDEKPDHVLLLGIWGMAGIGKTTIAKALYNEISQNFEGRKFIPHIRDKWMDNRKTSLQEQLLSSIDETNSTMIHSIELGKLILRDRLSLKRIFLVLDDVTNLDQLEGLCGNREWFGPGSRIIITTRDRSLLNVLNVDHVYRVNEMNYNQSVELFSWHAFKKATPEYYFAGLVKHLVEYCRGLPLALVVLGSFLREKSIQEWESTLEKFKSDPQQDLQKILKTSFDNISDDTTKNIFLDIACFLVGMDQKDVTQILYGSGYKAETAIRVLKEKCLVTVDEENKLQMHGLLQEMGREITRKASQIMPKQEYDVFLSFRGKDTHATFSSLLHTSLEKVGISVFKDVDDDGRRRGEQMSIQQLKAIKMSRFCVIVFSRNYADSKWCLLELENIIDCHKTKRQVVVPVFYDVDPEDVRNERGVIWEAFQDLVNRISAKEDKVRRWRDALHEAGDILGFVVEDYSRNRGEDVKKVTESVTRWVNRTNLFVATHPVGVQDGVRILVEKLNEQKSDDVLLLGIWGMGGIGKTTLAKALYNQIGCQFVGSSFLPDIREAWLLTERRASLQERILSDIFQTRERTIPNINSGKKRLQQRLHDKKVLLLLDDVNKREQLDALCGSREWFGPGSIIIITTRDRRLLIDHGVDHVHPMKEMDVSESTELFSWHAFKQPSPRQDFAELCENVVSYCGGLPLALFALGPEFGKLPITEWKNLLDGLREAPHPVVQEVLKISFDDLNDPKERDLFLDISFFYIGINKEDVIVHALKGYGDSVTDGITVLEDRSLVKVDENGKFGMHVLLREMGREILRELFRIEPGPMIYDVFLSFRADTRASFTSHLYTYLQNAGCNVFKDDESLQKGDQISISMMQAIGRSRISIVVLSKKYPNSRWCMVELEKILECRRTTNQQVLPVFYYVRPSQVLSSGVPSETSCEFKEAFEELLRNISGDKDRELGWKRALADISAIQGHLIENSCNESKDIKEVVAHVTTMLNKKYLFVAEHPVGVESRVADVMQLLHKHQEKDILVLGIWGMGGAGKTTIAKATYNKIGDNFEGRSFLLDVRKVWKEANGQVSLQNKLLSDIYQEMEIRIGNIDEGKIILQERLRQKKILLVLDDVNDQEQLNALCGSHEWFKEGSGIIITTTIKKLVVGAGKVEEKLQARVRKVGSEIYTVEKMEERESIELFSWYAFKQATPIEKFHELLLDIVSYSGRLPLALELLGSYFFDIGMELDDWKSTLVTLKKIPYHKVQKRLRICFDCLSNEEERDIFLDIAFFFIGMDRNDVIQILNGCRFSANTGINLLVDRSLVTIDRDNKIGMHNLLRDMGREIVREKLPKEPEKRSRLWDSSDVLDVLQSEVIKGTRFIEGMTLKLSKIKKIKLNAFEMMDKLRLLQLDGVELEGNFKNMSRNLRWLYWRRFPSSHTPTEFDQGKLVAIELEHSNLKQMWEETQMLDMLKILNLSHSHHLTKTPDFSYLPNLEKLSLEDCSELFYVSSTIGRLKKLKIINLKDCKKLLELPRKIYKLISLQTLILSGCEKINKLEEHLEQMKSLTTLEADGTGIGQMPCALIRSKSIRKISWRDWKGISRDVFPSMIIWSWTSPTNNVSSRMQRSAGLWSCIVSLIVPNSIFHGLSSIVSDLPKLRTMECSVQLPITGDIALDNLNATNLNEVEAMTPTPQVSNMNASNFLLIQMGMDSPVTKILRQSMFRQVANLIQESSHETTDQLPYIEVKDLEKRKSKRKSTSTTNSGVSPKAPKSQKITSVTTSKVATLIQESSHDDQVLQERTHAIDQLPYIEDPKLVSTTDGALIENSTITPFVVGEETPREPPAVESNMGRIEEAIAQTLKEMDSDDIFAELEKVLGGEPSHTKASPAGSKAAFADIPAVKILHECYEIIEGKDLKSLSTNENLLCKLKDKLTELAPIRSHLPPVFKEMTTKLERLYKDILDHFIPTSQVLDQHRSLLDSKSKVLQDLSSLKKRKLDLAASTTKINTSLDDVARKRAKLEEELNLLAEREDELNFSKEQSKVALDELKQELSSKLEEGKKIFEELPMVEAKAKEAEITQQSLSKQLEDVQQSLKITKA